MTLARGSHAATRLRSAPRRSQLFDLVAIEFIMAGVTHWKAECEREGRFRQIRVNDAQV